MNDRAPAAMTAIAEYSPTAAALAELRHRFQGVVFDVTTKEGIEHARLARRELRELRTDLEKKRVEIKAPALGDGHRCAGSERRMSAPDSETTKLRRAANSACMRKGLVAVDPQTLSRLCDGFDHLCAALETLTFGDKPDDAWIDEARVLTGEATWDEIRAEQRA